MKSKKITTGIALITMVCALFVGCANGLKGLLKLFLPNVDLNDTTNSLVQGYLSNFLGDNTTLTSGMTLPTQLPGVGNLDWALPEGSGISIGEGGVVNFTGESDANVPCSVKFSMLGQDYNVPYNLKVVKQVNDTTPEETLQQLALTNLKTKLAPSDDVNVTSYSITNYAPDGASKEIEIGLTEVQDPQIAYTKDTDGKITGINIVRGIQPKVVEIPVTLTAKTKPSGGGGEGGEGGENPGSTNPPLRAASPEPSGKTVSVYIPAIEVADGAGGSYAFGDNAVYYTTSQGEITNKISIAVLEYGRPEVTRGSVTGTFKGSVYSITATDNSGTEPSTVEYLKKDIWENQDFEIIVDEAIEGLKKQLEIAKKEASPEEYEMMETEVFDEFGVKNGDYKELRKVLLTKHQNVIIDMLNTLFFFEKEFKYTITYDREIALSIEPLYDTKQTWIENIRGGNGRAVCLNPHGSPSGKDYWYLESEYDINNDFVVYLCLMNERIAAEGTFGILASFTPSGENKLIASSSSRSERSGDVDVTLGEGGTITLKGSVTNFFTDPETGEKHENTTQIDHTFTFQGTSFAERFEFIPLPGAYSYDNIGPQPAPEPKPEPVPAP